jgi:hypothetical protein
MAVGRGTGARQALWLRCQDQERGERGQRAWGKREGSGRKRSGKSEGAGYRQPFKELSLLL